MTDLLQAAAEAVELGRAATPGPWGKRKDDWNLEVFPVKKVKKPFQAVAICEIDPDHYPTAKGDAALIAAAQDHVDLIRDLAAEVVRLRHLQVMADRYAYVRRLSPRKFAELFDSNIHGHGLFDDLVDRARTGDSHER